MKELCPLGNAIRTVLQLAESKWIHRAWYFHRLTVKQSTAIQMVTELIDHKIAMGNDTRWIHSGNGYLFLNNGTFDRCQHCNRLIEYKRISNHPKPECCNQQHESEVIE